MAILNLKSTSTPDNITQASTVAQTTKIAQSKNIKLVLFLFILCILALGATFYLSFQKTAISAQQVETTNQITNLKKELDTLKKDNIEGSQSAADALKEIEQNELRWSGIISAVQELVPYDSATKKPKINFLSYSGASDGKLTLSAVTNESSLPLFGDIAELIGVFNNSNFFKDAYVPSFSQGTSENGATTLSFIFNVTYQKPTLENSQDISVEDGDSELPVITENTTPILPTEGEVTENNYESPSQVDNPAKTPRVPTKK